MEDDVFIGPQATFTNDLMPRSRQPFQLRRDNAPSGREHRRGRSHPAGGDDWGARHGGRRSRGHQGRAGRHRRRRQPGARDSVARLTGPLAPVGTAVSARAARPTRGEGQPGTGSGRDLPRRAQASARARRGAQLIIHLATVERDLSPALGLRQISGLDDPNDAARQRRVEAHRLARSDRLDEVAQLQTERLVRFDLGRDDVAGAIGQVVLAERLRIAIDDAAVEQTRTGSVAPSS